MQIVHPGDLVRARRATWRVVDVRPYERCRHVFLAGTGVHADARCELLAPFDAIEPIATPSHLARRVGTSTWRRAAQHLIGRHGVPGVLKVSSAAGIDILPHQLEPAAAVLRGDGCRVLIADEVGLGKTIQACVLVAELRARAMADRVLILTPPGLRDQWRQELRRRFHLDADLADARGVRQRSRELPPDVSAWNTWPLAIASIDYIKRPEVLRPIVDCRWDVVIVDEAHRVANDGERRQAVAALAQRAAYVILLTATPHSGDADAFRSLCDLGSHGERLLIFRRTRAALASPVTRRVHRLFVRSTAAERRLHARLDAFARAVRAERGDADRDMWIALALLEKRAFSSAHALLLSVSRRLDSLAGVSPAGIQLSLPLDEDGETTAGDEAPAWQPALALRDVHRERALLMDIQAAAAACTRDDSKIRVLRRLIRRIPEPLIVFTEYRDTLTHLAGALGEPASLLHGGLSRQDRLATLESFTRNRVRLLLATDAAAEGLNLHHSCRAVVNLELPWNPMRLEQRIGRVDRIGQTRTVHAFHLVGADSGERDLLERLRRRIVSAQSAIGAPDPLDGALDDGDDARIESERVDVRDELQRLALARALPSSGAVTGRPLIAVAHNPHTRLRLAGRRVALWECAIEDGRERLVASHLVAASLAMPERDAVAAVAHSVAEWQAQSMATAQAFIDVARTRAEAIANALEDERGSPSQPGLFDRRGPFAEAALSASHEQALRAHAVRMSELRVCSEFTARRPQLRLVLVPRR